MKMKGFLVISCIIIGLFGCTETPAPIKRIPKKGPHRPIIQRPPRKIASCQERPITVAVIDTGYGPSRTKETRDIYDATLCKFGHKDFTRGVSTVDFRTVDEVPVDDHGHGTHVTGLIDTYARQGHANFCLIIIKYYNAKSIETENLENTVKAIKYATYIHADFINYSSGGITEKAKSEKEIEAVKEYLDQGGKFVSAAGNERTDIDEIPYYPAMDDDRVIVVGNGKSLEDHANTSNYGKRVNAWENGDDVKSYDTYMTGTSQATAIHTGKMIAEIHSSCK